LIIADNVFTLQDDADPTRQAKFNCSAIGAGLTRTFSFPNSETTLAGTASAQNFTGVNNFSNAINTFGSSAAASTYNFASGATTTGLTKTVNIGTGGLSGSITAITIGALAGTSTTTMNGQTDIGGTTTSVIFVRVVGAVTTGAPEISAQGSDANINLALTPKGTGAVTTAASLTAIGGISGGTF
jgi:hypothetical protein